MLTKFAQNINSHLSFSPEDRIKQAKTMKWLSDKVIESGNLCVIDFICLTPEKRQAFNSNEAVIVWVNRIKEGRLEDTNQIFVPQENYDYRVTEKSGDPDRVAGEISQILFGG